MNLIAGSTLAYTHIFKGKHADGEWEYNYLHSSGWLTSPQTPQRKALMTHWNQVCSEERKTSQPCQHHLSWSWGGKSQTWSQFLLRITSECVLQKPRQHSLWRIWFGSCWLLGPGEPISNGQGGVSESCQSCYPTCCSCSGMVQSGIITARSKTGRLQISSRGETRGAVESCHSHPSLDLGPTWLKVFFKKAKGWPLTRQMNMNRCGVFVLLLSIAQETWQQVERELENEMQQRPSALHGWLTPGSPPDYLRVLMNLSWHRDTLGYFLHKKVAVHLHV